MYLTQKEQQLLQEIPYHQSKNMPIDGHPTATAFVVDRSITKVLMIYHKKYDSWGWVGGHVEKGESILQASIRELQEETGLLPRQPIIDCPISLEKMWAFDHYHYNVTFAFFADEKEQLMLNEQETDGIRWIDIDRMENFVSEDHMLPIYHKIVARLRDLTGSIG